MSVKEYGKEKIQGLKGKVASAAKAFALKWGIIIGGSFLLIIVLVSVISSLITSALGGDDESEGTEDWETATEESWEQFVRFMHLLEDNEGEKIESGIKYYKVGLVNGNRTVGYGIDLETCGFEENILKESGKTKLKNGDWVKADIIDKYENQEYENNKTAIDNAFGNGGISIPIYQTYALISFGYQNGTNALLNKFYNNEGIVNAYKNHYKVDNKANYEHKEKINTKINKFAEEYISWDSNIESVVARREAEWGLFQTGWFGYRHNYKSWDYGFNEYCKISTGGTGSGNYDTSCKKEYKYILGKFTSTKGKTFTIIDQTEIDDWEKNCNRAAAVIIASGNSKKNINQLVTIADQGEVFPDEQSYEGGRKTWTVLDTNLKVKKEMYKDTNGYSGTEIAKWVREAYNNNGYVSFRFNGKTEKSSHSKNSWALNGHWVAILDYKKESSKEYMFVADSGHGNTGWYPIDEFKNFNNIHYLTMIVPK